MPRALAAATSDTTTRPLPTPWLPATTTAPPVAAASTSLAWTDCSFPSTSRTESGAFDCAAMQVPVCYADTAPCPLGVHRNHTLQVMRRQTNKDVTNAPTVWIVSDAHDDAETADLMDRIAQQQGGGVINVYAMQNRLTTPPLGATDRTTDLRSACMIFATYYSESVAITNKTTDVAVECSKWVQKALGTNGTNAYSLDSAARDLTLGLQLVQSQELKTNPNVYVMAVGKASGLVHRFMTSGAGNTTIAGYMFDTPHLLQLPSTRDEIVGASMSRFLEGCETDTTCRAKFKNLTLSINEVLVKLEEAVDKPIKSVWDELNDADKNSEKTSPCIRKLMAASYKADRDLKPSHGLRRYMAKLRSDPVGIKYVPILIYRAHRCNEKQNDVDAVDEITKKMSFEEPTWVQDVWAARFVDRVVTFSELWPSPSPLNETLIASFEKSAVNDGTMLGQLPLYCLYTTSDSPACQGSYKNERLTYKLPQSTNISANISTPSDVLILTSRLSAVGSASAANDLYDIFAGRTAVLVESDNLAGTELGGSSADTLFQVVGAFVMKKTQKLSGKWRVDDLSTSSSDWSTTEPIKSTMASPPAVTVNFTLTADQTLGLFSSTSDPYEYIVPKKCVRSCPTLTSSDDDDNSNFGLYIGLLGASLVVVFVYITWARCRADKTPDSPPPPPSSLHVNVTVHHHVAPPYQHTQPAQQPPLAIPLGPSHQPPYAPFPSTAFVETTHVAPPHNQPTQWIAEPVNAYSFSYTQTAPPMRTGA